MSLLHANVAVTEAETHRQENDLLKDRLAGLSRATASISEHADADGALQEVVDSV